MIGDGWDGDPSARPESDSPGHSERRRIVVVTGSRAEFGLLRPVMRAIAAREDSELLVVAAGSHLISPALTYRDVKALFPVADAVPMQVAAKATRFDDAQAVGRGVEKFARVFHRLAADWVVVLGDRVEAFAGAAAASIGGWALAHIHGGDRAEGIADEAMRHAVTKLAHLHFPATEQSRERILRMGERTESVHAVGSPAIDDLAGIPPLPDGPYAELGRPTVVFLLHPVGRSTEREEAAAAAVLEALRGERVLALHPNHDPGREGVLRAIESAGVPAREHLPRDEFVGLLKRLAAEEGERGGVILGNSSAALIESAAIRLPAVDIGPRQGGRERAGNALHAEESAEDVRRALREARRVDRKSVEHPYGDGRAGERIAALLASVNPRDPRLLRKRNTY